MWKMRKPFRQNEMKYLFTFIETVLVHPWKIITFYHDKSTYGFVTEMSTWKQLIFFYLLLILLPPKKDRKLTFH